MSEKSETGGWASYFTKGNVAKVAVGAAGGATMFGMGMPMIAGAAIAFPVVGLLQWGCGLVKDAVKEKIEEGKEAALQKALPAAVEAILPAIKQGILDSVDESIPEKLLQSTPTLMSTGLALIATAAFFTAVGLLFAPIAAVVLPAAGLALGVGLILVGAALGIRHHAEHASYAMADKILEKVNEKTPDTEKEIKDLMEKFKLKPDSKRVDYTKWYIGDLVKRAALKETEEEIREGRMNRVQASDARASAIDKAESISAPIIQCMDNFLKELRTQTKDKASTQGRVV